MFFILTDAMFIVKKNVLLNKYLFFTNCKTFFTN